MEVAASFWQWMRTDVKVLPSEGQLLFNPICEALTGDWLHDKEHVGMSRKKEKEGPAVELSRLALKARGGKPLWGNIKPIPSEDHQGMDPYRVRMLSSLFSSSQIHTTPGDPTTGLSFHDLNACFPGVGNCCIFLDHEEPDGKLNFIVSYVTMVSKKNKKSMDFAHK